jgi:predicted TIM-barrel fold metal-dependent hydrolase
MRIDVHAHYYPDNYIKLLMRLGNSAVNAQVAQSADFSDRLRQLDEAEVDCQILSAIGWDTQLLDPTASAVAARCINDSYAELIARHSGRLQAWGWIPLGDTDLAIKEASRCLDELGFAGICLPPAIHSLTLDDPPLTLDDPRFYSFWDEMNRRRTVIYVHPVGVLSCCHWGTDKFMLDMLCGSPMQEAIAACRLVYSGLTRRFPMLRFIFAACGGAMPLVWPVHEKLLRGKLQHADWVASAGLDPADPMAEFRRFYYDSSTANSRVALLVARETYGIDRLVLGSDATFGSVTGMVSYIKETPLLSDVEKHAILDQRAQSILHLKSRH